MINMTTLNVIYVDFNKYDSEDVTTIFNQVKKALPYPASEHTIILPSDWKFIQYMVDDNWCEKGAYKENDL